MLEIILLAVHLIISALVFLGIQLHILKVRKELTPMPVTMVADGMEIRL